MRNSCRSSLPGESFITVKLRNPPRQEILLEEPKGIIGNSVSENPVVGTLNLYLRMPDPMQKESAQSDNPALRRRPKTDDLSDFQNMSTF